MEIVQHYRIRDFQYLEYGKKKSLAKQYKAGTEKQTEQSRNYILDWKD